MNTIRPAGGGEWEYILWTPCPARIIYCPIKARGKT